MRVQIIERKRFRCGTKRPGTFAVFPVDTCWLPNWDLDLSKQIMSVSARTPGEAVICAMKHGHNPQAIWAIEVVSNNRIISLPAGDDVTNDTEIPIETKKDFLYNENVTFGTKKRIEKIE